MISGVDNVTREKLRLSNYVIMCCKPIIEQAEQWYSEISCNCSDVNLVNL